MVFCVDEMHVGYKTHWTWFTHCCFFHCKGDWSFLFPAWPLWGAGFLDSFNKMEEEPLSQN